jgi:hypothetical protein
MSNVIQFRAKNQAKFKFTVVDFLGNRRVIYADSYTDMIHSCGVNNIKSSVRVKA